MSAVKEAITPISLKVLKGWLEVPKRKVSQNLRFFRLRGHSEDCKARNIAIFQLISRHHVNSDMAKKLAEITPESCVSVSVRQLLRPESAQRHAEGEVGRYDYEIEDVEVLNHAAANLPFLPNNEDGVDSLVRAQHRQIEMRSDNLGGALRERARIKTILRNEMEFQGFLEVETPLLFKSTPEGAREFLVPTRKRGQFFALPQSPQQYKQILMAGGIQRYYQFAKCFRDEDSRADRQLEFTQLDLEMAFVEMEDVMQAVSSIILSVDDGKLFNVQDGQIRRMKYQEAMEKYGSDKPDLRFGLEICAVDEPSNVDHCIDILTFPIPKDVAWRNKMTTEVRELLKDLVDVEVNVKTPTKSPSSYSSLYQQYATRLDDDSRLVLLARRRRQLTGGSTSMGQARLSLQSYLEHKFLVTKREAGPPFSLCWITDFPLFSPVSSDTNHAKSLVGEEEGLTSTHHPFTAPHPSDLPILVDPGSTREALLQVRGQHYDLVMNGVEIGGGSIRIHHAKLQRRVFGILGMTQERQETFHHLLRVLESGCPPHGGFAVGFDRFVAMLCGKRSIRDVIAFPKTGGGVDALIGSPSVVSERTLREYHIALTRNDNTNGREIA